MRSLIERAVRRKADELLKSFSDILTGRPAELTADAAALYEPEIAAAEEFHRVHVGAVVKSGHFEVVAYPTVYNAKRIGSIPEAANAVRKNEVMLRGWDFPHTDRENAAPFSSGFQSSTVWSRYVHEYFLFLSRLYERSPWTRRCGSRSRCAAAGGGNWPRWTRRSRGSAATSHKRM